MKETARDSSLQFVTGYVGVGWKYYWTFGSVRAGDSGQQANAAIGAIIVDSRILESSSHFRLHRLQPRGKARTEYTNAAYAEQRGCLATHDQNSLAERTTIFC